MGDENKHVAKTGGGRKINESKRNTGQSNFYIRCTKRAEERGKTSVDLLLTEEKRKQIRIRVERYRRAKPRDKSAGKVEQRAKK